MARSTRDGASPFNPGYGKQPLVFGGHEREVEELTDVFDTLDFGENHSVLVSGLRGAGKTSMLTVLQDAARERGWLVISDDASAGLMDRVMRTTIPNIVDSLQQPAKARLKSLKVWEFGADWEYVARERDSEPLLRNDLIALSNAVEHGGVLITIDEVSSSRTRLHELARFALEIQHALTAGADLMVVFAGVKVDLEELLKQEHLTYLRRSRDLDFRRLDPLETKRVLAETARIGGRSIDADALDRLASIAQGYPYLIQLAGDYAWRHNRRAGAISLDDADYALGLAVKAVQSRVISRVYDDLSESDKKFVRAMAHDEGRTRISDVMSRMGVSNQYVQVYKRRLIASGYVQQAGRGYVSFSLPYLDQYLKALTGDAGDDGAEAVDAWVDYPAPRI